MRFPQLYEKQVETMQQQLDLVGVGQGVRRRWLHMWAIHIRGYGWTRDCPPRAVLRSRRHGLSFSYFIICRWGAKLKQKAGCVVRPWVRVYA